jgi:hypothetical protein
LFPAPRPNCWHIPMIPTRLIFWPQTSRWKKDPKG